MSHWKPMRNLQGTVKEQLAAQFDDRSQTATMADDLADAARRYHPSQGEALAASFVLKAIDDPQFGRDFAEHD